MRAVVLAAGYATRLYPLTRDRAKPLLPVGGVTILDRLVTALAGAGVEEIAVVANHRFAPQFEEWRAAAPARAAVQILDDGTTSEENRLGAVGDLRFALGRIGVASDLVVAAADNLFGFSLASFVEFFRRAGTDCITVRREPDPARLARTGVVEIDPSSRVLRFEEKPARPRSTYASPPLYAFTRATLPLVPEYLASGGNPDAPGHFIAWLCPRRPVHAFVFEGEVFDIGTLESYRALCRRFEANP